MAKLTQDIHVYNKSNLSSKVFKSANGGDYTSKWFTRGEMCVNDSAKEFKVDTTLVKCLDNIREHFNKPLHVNCCYRNPSHNSRVGGSSTSLHMTGAAADIYISGIDFTTICQYAELLGMQEIGWYYDSSHCHLGIKSNKYRYKCRQATNTYYNVGTFNPPASMKISPAFNPNGTSVGTQGTSQVATSSPAAQPVSTTEVFKKDGKITGNEIINGISKDIAFNNGNNKELLNNLNYIATVFNKDKSNYTIGHGDKNISKPATIMNDHYENDIYNKKDSPSKSYYTKTGLPAVKYLQDFLLLKYGDKYDKLAENTVCDKYMSAILRRLNQEFLVLPKKGGQSNTSPYLQLDYSSENDRIWYNTNKDYLHLGVTNINVNTLNMMIQYCKQLAYDHPELLEDEDKVQIETRHRYIPKTSDKNIGKIKRALSFLKEVNWTSGGDTVSPYLGNDYDKDLHNLLKNITDLDYKYEIDNAVLSRLKTAYKNKYVSKTKNLYDSNQSWFISAESQASANMLSAQQKLNSIENKITERCGLLIDLTKGEIKSGNNKFYLNSSGQLTAVEVNLTGKFIIENGTIGAWTLTNSGLTNVNKEMMEQGAKTNDSYEICGMINKNDSGFSNWTFVSGAKLLTESQAKDVSDSYDLIHDEDIYNLMADGKDDNLEEKDENIPYIISCDTAPFRVRKDGKLIGLSGFVIKSNYNNKEEIRTIQGIDDATLDTSKIEVEPMTVVLTVDENIVPYTSMTGKALTQNLPIIQIMNQYDTKGSINNYSTLTIGREGGARMTFGNWYDYKTTAWLHNMPDCCTLTGSYRFMNGVFTDENDNTRQNVLEANLPASFNNDFFLPYHTNIWIPIYKGSEGKSADDSYKDAMVSIEKKYNSLHYVLENAKQNSGDWDGTESSKRQDWIWCWKMVGNRYTFYINLWHYNKYVGV